MGVAISPMMLRVGASANQHLSTISMLGGEHRPHDAEHQPEMTPMIDVDNESLGDCPEKCGKDGKIWPLPRKTHKDQPEAAHDRYDDEGRKRHAGNPSTGHERI